MTHAGEPIPGQSKRCYRCQKVKPIHYFGRNRKSRDMYAHLCKRCRAIGKDPSEVQNIATEYTENSESNGRMKRCGDCRTFKPLGQFWKARKNLIDGRQNICKECSLIRSRKTCDNHKQGIGVTQVDSKVCRYCRKMKPAADFYLNATSKDHLSSRCKDCDYKQVSPDSRLIKRLEKYGLTLERYQAMLKEQNGVCALCKKADSRQFFGKTYALSIDHNHTTLKVRKLVCARCNQSIGCLEYFLREGLLENALQYIQEHS